MNLVKIQQIGFVSMLKINTKRIRNGIHAGMSNNFEHFTINTDTVRLIKAYSAHTSRLSAQK